MGDLRFSRTYEKVRSASNRVGTIRDLSDEDVIAALGGASRGSDHLLTNVLTTEALNRVKRGQRVLATVSEGVVVMDCDGTVTVLNPAAERVLGWLSEEVEGRNVRDVLAGGATSAEADQLVAAALAPVRTGETSEGEVVRLVLRDGSSFSALLRSSPIIVDGGVTGIVVLFPQRPSIPPAQSGVTDARANVSQPLAQASPDSTRDASRTTRPRIMIVEDESIVAMSLEDALVGMGYDVVAVVASGEAAVKTAMAEPLDLVLMDIVLQGELDGVAAAELIRDSVDVPVIFLTAFSDEATLKRAKLTEPEGYLVKPYTERELHAAVEVALHNSARERDRSMARRALLSREKLLQEILDNTPAMIYLKAIGGHFLLVNKQFESVTAVTRAQAKGKTGEEFLDPVLAEMFDAHDSTVIREGRALEYEQTLPLPDGVHTYASLKFPLRDKNGAISGVCGVSNDVTVHQRAADAMLQLNATLAERVAERTQYLVAANETQQAAYRDLEAFMHYVSHDLRAPARGIAALAEALQEDAKNGQHVPSAEIVTRIGAESKRLGTLITELLEFTRSGLSAIAPQCIDMTALAREIMDSISLRDPSHEVDVTIQDGVKGTGDPILLRIVLENLLENAWKYSSKSPRPKIEFGMSAENGEASYFVRDNGVGFPIADTPRLFKPFERLHSAQDYPGTGLGLSSVQRIIERHKGRTWAAGAAGKGATFSFTLGPRVAPMTTN